MVVVAGRQRKLRWEGSHCAALAGGGTPSDAYVCAIYGNRLRTCRDFDRGSANCLNARRSVRLSRWVWLTKSSLDGHNPVFADFTTGDRASISRAMIE